MAQRGYILSARGVASINRALSRNGKVAPGLPATRRRHRNAQGGGRTGDYMFSVSVTRHMSGESQEEVGGVKLWNLAVKGGTAQPLFGQIQLIPAFDNSATGIAIPSGSPAIVYLTYRIYDTVTSAYVHEFEEEISVSTTVPTDSWHTKYYALSTVDFEGSVDVGHEGAVYLPSPKSVVDVDPEVEA